MENHLPSKLLIFGDSWPWGAELNPTEKPYGTLIAEYLKYSVKNYSQPATSIDHLPLQLLTAQQRELSLKGCKALFTLTSPSRSMYYRDGNYQEIQIYRSDPVSKHYYAYQWSKEMDRYQTNLVVLSLQTMCKSLGIQDYYVSGFSHLTLNYPGIDKNKIYNEGKTSLAELLGMKPLENVKHPDQTQHQLIAEKLQAWIANC